MRAYPEIMMDLDFSDRVVDVIEGASTPSSASPKLVTRA